MKFEDSAVYKQGMDVTPVLVEALEDARLTIKALQGRGNSAGLTLSIIDRALTAYHKAKEEGK